MNEFCKSISGTTSQYKAAAPEISNFPTYKVLSYSSPAPSTSYSLASTAPSYSENSQSPSYSYPVHQPNYSVASPTFSAEPVLLSYSQPGPEATQAAPKNTDAQSSFSLPSSSSTPAKPPGYLPPAPQPSYSLPAPAGIFSPIGTASSYSSSEDDEYGTSQATFWNAEPKEDENERPDSTNNKRQATGFPVDKHSVFTKVVGIPDIWDIFSEEWGQRISSRMDGTDLKRKAKQVNFF